jgi:DNA polymerase III delta subunit
VADPKPAYLISGYDQAIFDAWRNRLRERARDEGPSATLEVVRGDAEAAVEAIGSLTLSVGRRYVLVDEIERWSDRDQKRVEEALGQLSADTLVVFIAWGKAPKRLEKAVGRIGGELKECPRPRSYPAWIAERAKALGFAIDREAAQLLAELIGKEVEGDKSDEREQRRQRRLLHELEKLALFASDDGRIDPSAVESLTRSAVETRAYALADAIIDQDPQRAIRIAEELRARGEDFMYILFALLRQLRSCRLAWAMRAAGKPKGEVERELGGNPWAAKSTVAQAERADGEQLVRALELLADLDYAIRGAGQRDPETELTLTVVRAAGGRESVAA